MIWVGQNNIAYFSLSVSNLCLSKDRKKNLTLKTCAPDFSARSMTKLYTKIGGTRAISLFDFLKTWLVWPQMGMVLGNLHIYSAIIGVFPFLK